MQVGDAVAALPLADHQYHRYYFGVCYRILFCTVDQLRLGVENRLDKLKHRLCVVDD
jgi:hypothetical protein